MCDEAQFYSTKQCDQLARVVDDLGVDVFAFGLITDFRGVLFDGTKRMLEIADDRVPAWRRAAGGGERLTTRGPSTGPSCTRATSWWSATPPVPMAKLFGDIVRYELLCRHYRERHRPQLSSNRREEADGVQDHPGSARLRWQDRGVKRVLVHAT